MKAQAPNLKNQNFNEIHNIQKSGYHCFYPRTAPMEGKCFPFDEDLEEGLKAAKIPIFSCDRRRSFFVFATYLLLLSTFLDSAL